MSPRRTERKKMSKTDKMMVYTNTIPPKRLTGKRQALIEEFKKQTLMNQELLGSAQWIDKLKAYMISRHQTVSFVDIKRWIETNKWITSTPETGVNQNDQIANDNESENIRQQQEQVPIPHAKSSRMPNSEAETPQNTASGEIPINVQPFPTSTNYGQASSSVAPDIPSSFHPYETSCRPTYFNTLLYNGRVKKLDDYHLALNACQFIGNFIKQNDELRPCLVPLKNITAAFCRNQKRVVLDVSHKEAFADFNKKRVLVKQEHGEAHSYSAFNQDYLQEQNDDEDEEHINVVDCDSES